MTVGHGHAGGRARIVATAQPEEVRQFRDLEPQPGTLGLGKAQLQPRDVVDQPLARHTLQQRCDVRRKGWRHPMITRARTVPGTASSAASTPSVTIPPGPGSASTTT